MIHTNLEETSTSGEGERSTGEWYFSYICYALLFFKRDMKQTWQNINIYLILWVTILFYFLSVWFISFFFEDFIYLFLERWERREKERNIYQLPPHSPNGEPGPEPRHVPRTGIEPVTFWFAVWCSTHWPTPARVVPFFFLN